MVREVQSYLIKETPQLSKDSRTQFQIKQQTHTDSLAAISLLPVTERKDEKVVHRSSPCATCDAGGL